MTTDIFLALAFFAFATLFSPGPNNLMLMASGANFGLRRSLPHLLGVATGFPAMLTLVGLGVMQLFDAWPHSHTVLRVIAVVYMFWLAWKIAHAAPPKDADTESRPLTYLQASAFQWVNPKAWTMGLGAITLYATSRDLDAILMVAGTYLLIGCFSAAAWTVLGTGIRRLLNRPQRLMIFNWTMAGLLLASLIPVFLMPS
ncbi:LysE family translocator [Shimia sp. R11_0]|uniref:Cysteine/O-acetylserine efflux protein n=1 Tax=Shimia marina TaxID=321267 RepID=A0A0P1FF31_9RHOB|nr:MULTISPECIES: LysE family translocator [Shimia]MBO9476499.1 LysE family translocator [Shimia sp. R11_0]CUH53885.1 Cysteine/O-acetylserine efflux protein [Shimia marina]SFE20325.1 Threonine/homoserine/homoserine lactone efflux protein [Shimia marina]